MEQKIHDIRSISLLLALNKTVRPASGGTEGLRAQSVKGSIIIADSPRLCLFSAPLLRGSVSTLILRRVARARPRPLQLRASSWGPAFTRRSLLLWEGVPVDPASTTARSTASPLA
jgi:hypothetical protein